jgi:hypothetical protein
MNQAIIGVIGVVVGGAIAVFAQQLRPNARSVRGAARLLDGELGLTWAYAHTVLKARSWQPTGRALSAELWADRRSLLAAELGREDWKSVTAGYEAVEEIRAAQSAGHGVLSEVETRLLNEAVGKIVDARNFLDYLSGSLPTTRQAWRRRRQKKDSREFAADAAASAEE